jgi:thiamine pyrophosphate-dependent acetolactate synthase large subunit-like protein
MERAQAHGRVAQKKSLHAQERDSEANRQHHQEFVAKVCATPPEHLIFLDESGFTTAMTRLYARRPDGRRIHEASNLFSSGMGLWRGIAHSD